MQQTVAAPAPTDALDVVGRELTVLSVPAAHPYIRSVTAAPGITRASEPTASTDAWAPSAALDPAWIVEHADVADLLHIHFGTESFSVQHLASCLAAARSVGWPVVFTVHDLDHPQLADQSHYRDQLDVLVPGSDAVLTLTAGAADEVRRRWGRTAVVSAHPSILPVGAPLPRVFPSDEVRIGMHLKDLRPNVDAVAMVRALADALTQLAQRGITADAEVRMHREVRDPAAREAVREVAANSERMVLIEHERLDDRELANTLARLDVCVLPYGHGTHSGWLELCWDLGVGVVAPAVGFYAEQHASVRSFTLDDSLTDSGDSLANAIAAVLEAAGETRAGTAARAEEFDRRRLTRVIDDERVACVHADLYRSLIAERRS